MLALSRTYTLNKKIRQTALVDIYRGFRAADGVPVVAKVLRHEYPTALDVARLRHEYAIIRSLDVPGVVRAYGLERFGNGLALILQDAGDESLHKLIETGESCLRRLIKIAICMARVVGVVHARQILHKDIKPHHLFVDPQDPEALLLVDFGIATRLTQERQGLVAATQLEGSLPYLAPEQTGRMNRAVDRRSDLYSVGVTLYELFTGRLPFVSDDPLELVHAHLARTPATPLSIRPEIPVPLSQMIMKLLSKTAEERYQSAAGLQHDLEVCLERLDTTGQVAPFTLGQRDVCGELRISEKLYGRQTEVDSLFSALERARQGHSELLLLAGSSGIGKSTLVGEFGHMIGSGNFVSGKFEYLNRGIPYAALAHACRELVRIVLAEPPEALERRKKRVLEAVGVNGRVLVDFVPELELVIGPRPPVPELGPAEAQNRFENVFQSFLGACGSEGQPLLLFLDDLQWADAASLKLLQLVLTASDQAYLLIVGAYRDNEVDPVHPLSLMREEAEKHGAAVTALELQPLQMQHVVEWLSDALGSQSSRMAVLAGILHGKTRGNPFFLGQLLRTLVKQGSLRFSAESRDWEWDLGQVQGAVVTDNVVDFMVDKLRELPERTQQVLRLAACIGYETDARTLACVAQQSTGYLTDSLWPALEEGLVVPLDANYRYESVEDEGSSVPNARYRFLHDRVQQASYSLLDENEREKVHLAVGRLLLAAHRDAATDDRLFEIADHMNRGAGLITETGELKTLARLNLDTGRKARESAAANLASGYFRRAAELLGSAGWVEAYDIAYPAHLLQAECEYLQGNLPRALELLAAVERCGATLLDRVPARNLRTWIFLNMGHFAEAVQNSVETIRLLGVELPPTDDPAALGAAIGAEFGAYQAARAERPIESLADLPEMTQPHELALLETYAKAIPAAFNHVKELMVLIVLKAASLSLRCGSGPDTPFFYAQYGLVHSIITADFATAYRFGELGLRMSERRTNPAFSVPVKFIFAGFLSHWRQPIQESLEHLRDTLRLSRELGDTLHMGFCIGFYPTYRFYAGQSLDEIQSGLPGYLELANKTADSNNRGFLMALRQGIAALKGQTRDLHSFDETGFCEADFVSEASLPVRAFYGAVKAAVCCVAQRFDAALEVTERIEPLPNIFYNGEYKLYRALSLAQKARTAAGAERDRLIARLEEDTDVLRQWAESSPANHAHRLALVQAERAALDNDTLSAMTLYDEAISAAKANGFIHHQALANELCARFHLGHARSKVARPYFAEAHYAYARWGALAKVEQLESEHGELLDSIRGAHPATASVTSTDRRTTTAETRDLGGRLDLGTAIKATEAIATELISDRVVERVMRTLVENAGAQRGALVLSTQGVLTVHATLAVEPEEVSVGLAEDLDASGKASSAVVRWVARTRQSAILGDASSDPRFRADRYVAEHKPKSVLAVPMLHRGSLTGVLYLENNAAVDGFCPARIQLLQFLAAQAAAALENARLYGDLRLATDRLKQANATLEAQVAERTQELSQTLKELWSEMDLARKIQTVLLPKTRRVGDYDIAATMLPADTVGGDYYDVIETAKNEWVLIGDVSGHGVTAGLIMMMIQTAVRTLILSADDRGEAIAPSTVLRQANDAVRGSLERIDRGQYMTMTALQLNGREILFSGLHQDILVFRAATHTVERIETRGVWIGVLEEMGRVLHDDRFELEPGDTMLLFTDGIVEFKADDSLLGTDGLAARFAALALQAKEPAAIVGGLMGALGDQSPHDDVTLVVLRYTPEARIERLPLACAG